MSSPSSIRSASLPFLPISSGGKTEMGLRPRDLERYQTVFARKEGAIAAPTAGLHFTKTILDEMEGRGRQGSEDHPRCRARDVSAGEGRQDQGPPDARGKIRDLALRSSGRSRPQRARAGPSRRSARPSSGRSRAPGGREVCARAGGRHRSLFTPALNLKWSTGC